MPKIDGAYSVGSLDMVSDNDVVGLGDLVPEFKRGTSLSEGPSEPELSTLSGCTRPVGVTALSLSRSIPKSMVPQVAMRVAYRSVSKGCRFMSVASAARLAEYDLLGRGSLSNDNFTRLGASAEKQFRAANGTKLVAGIGIHTPLSSKSLGTEL